MRLLTKSPARRPRTPTAATDTTTPTMIPVLLLLEDFEAGMPALVLGVTEGLANSGELLAEVDGLGETEGTADGEADTDGVTDTLGELPSEGEADDEGLLDGVLEDVTDGVGVLDGLEVGDV